MLWADFMSNTGKSIHKHPQYFPVYERHFSPWRDRTLTFWEIGVQSGGSLQMWQRYFGPAATIVGLDIDARCKEHESTGIYVRIGDQAEEAFLNAVIAEFGIPDIVLDDGSHQMDHVFRTFSTVYPRMPKNGVYLVEDMHAAYWDRFGGGINKKSSFINIAKDLIDKMHAGYCGGEVENDPTFSRDTSGICFYDSVVVFEKNSFITRESIRVG